MFIKFDATNRPAVIALVVMLSFFFSAPAFLNPFLFYLLTLVLINFIVVTSFRFVTLMGGFSFVHAGLWGLGAYATAILTTKLDIPFWGGIPLAALATSVVSLVIALPVLRTRGVYFILATFASFEAMRQVWIRFKTPFGGHYGITQIVTPPEVPYYYLVLCLTGLSLAAMYRIEFSRLGDAIKSVASDEALAESVGIHAWRYRVVAFVIGGFFVGLAGALFAHTTGGITPADFTFYTTLSILVAVLLGGTRTIFGPLIGISLIAALEYFGKDLLTWLPMVLGSVIIAAVLLLPGGLEGLPRRISEMRQGKSSQ